MALQNRFAQALFFLMALTVLAALEVPTPPFHPVLAKAEEDYSDVVTASGVADISSTSPGDHFQAGVKFTLKEGWHLYWLNPGDSGLPTSVVFKVPAEFKISELKWPAPMHFMQPGGIRGYGYENELLLFSDLEVPASAVVGTTVSIPIVARWLACAQVCVPGRANLALTLPVKASSVASNHEIFEKYEKLLPRSEVDGIRTVNAKVTKTPGEPAGTAEVELVFESARDLGDVMVLAGHDRSLSSTEPTIEKNGLRTLVRFSTKLSPGKTLSSGTFPILLFSPEFAALGVQAFVQQVGYPS